MNANEVLIFGKDNTQRITSLEVTDDSIELFIQQEDGSVKSEFRKNRFWITSPRDLGGFTRLKGDLHYKYGKQFITQKDYYNYRNTHKRNDLYSISDAKEGAMVKDGITQFLGMKHNEVTILSFDIETTGLTHDANSKVLIISNTFRKNGVITRKLFGYSDYESQGEMIDAWTSWVREVDPSILIGHNIVPFDIPYLNYVALKSDTSLCLGRDGSYITISKYESKFRVDGSRDLGYHRVKCYGREIVDTMFLAYKYDIGRKYESYGLKPIIKQEGLEVKDRVFYDAGKIRFNYTIPEEWIKIKDYAMFDADDSLALYDLMAAPFFYMTQSIPKSFQMVTESASGSQINSIMVRSYLQEGHSLPITSPHVGFEGAISFGIPGIYRNCLKADVNSLYPSIMREYQVGLEDKDPKKHFQFIVEYFSVERLKNKKLAKDTGDKYYDDLQNAQKTFANSFYGFMGAPGLNFNCMSSASFVTKRGREILTKAVEWASGRSISHYLEKDE